MLQFFVDYLLFPIVVIGEFAFLFHGAFPRTEKQPQKVPARSQQPSVGAAAAAVH